jgi:hypothetical protein
LKQLKHAATLAPPEASRLSSFYQADAARTLHRGKTLHHVNRTIRAELSLIRAALSDPTLPTLTPISHLVNRTPLGTAYSDSSLLAAGDYSPELQFWWYLKWPDSVRTRTIKHLKNNDNGLLIDINVLEYAAIIITYLACYHAISHSPPDGGADPYPVVLIRTNNSSCEAWARKGARVSLASCALGSLQASLLIRNPVGARFSHILTTENVVMDLLSRIPSELSLLTEFPLIYQTQKGLNGCQRFLPSAELTSCIMDALLQGVCTDPIALNKRLLAAPGRTTSLPGALA